MSATKYDAAYFIAKFEAIPDEKWNIGSLKSDDGSRACAIGHCDSQSGEAYKLARLFPEAENSHLCGAAFINDGFHPAYQQPTPKARILAALRDLQAQPATP